MKLAKNRISQIWLESFENCSNEICTDKIHTNVIRIRQGSPVLRSSEQISVKSQSAFMSIIVDLQKVSYCKIE